MSRAYEPIIKMRDRFVELKEPEAAEICNELMAILDKSPSLFILSREESKELASYFISCGYISHEFHQPVHDILDRLFEFVKRVK